MAQKQTLKAAPRTSTGSGHLNKMRREGWLPSVMYGRGTTNQNLMVEAKSFADLLAKSTSANIIINMDIEGVGNSLAFLQAVQHNALSGSAIHADFLAIDENTEITAHVPIHPVGEAAGVKTGGLLDLTSHTIEIHCLPNDLPDFMEVDVTRLEIGDSLHISDLAFPKGVRPTHAGDVVVAHVGKPGAALSEDAASTSAAVTPAS
jgi:large subunit ribosomal protein L25